VDVERLFTHRWKLEQAEEAYRLFDTQTTGKAVILPSYTDMPMAPNDVCFRRQSGHGRRMA